MQLGSSRVAHAQSLHVHRPATRSAPGRARRNRLCAGLVHRDQSPAPRPPIERTDADIWLGVAATASGFGIWATHFIAMLAFAPGIPSGYNVMLTVLSLIAAIVLTGIGLGVALSRTVPGASGSAARSSAAASPPCTTPAWPPSRSRPHHLGSRWSSSRSRRGADRLGSARVGLIDGDRKWKIYGALLLTLAICSHHFTAMGAASIMPDPRIACPNPPSRPAGWPSPWRSPA